jgi:hypothetical protein
LCTEVTLRVFPRKGDSPLFCDGNFRETIRKVAAYLETSVLPVQSSVLLSAIMGTIRCNAEFMVSYLLSTSSRACVMIISALYHLYCCFIPRYCTLQMISSLPGCLIIPYVSVHRLIAWVGNPFPNCNKPFT